MKYLKNEFKICDEKWILKENVDNKFFIYQVNNSEESYYISFKLRIFQGRQVRPAYQYEDDKNWFYKSTNLDDCEKWISHKRNIKPKEHTGRSYESISKRVCQYSKSGEFIASFDSMTSAAKAINGTSSGICQCCMGKLKTHKGYIFKYETV